LALAATGATGGGGGGNAAWMAAGDEPLATSPHKEARHQQAGDHHQQHRQPQQQHEQRNRNPKRGRSDLGKDAGLLSAAADLAALKGASPLKPPRPGPDGSNDNGGRRAKS
ncbi:unnamed protein product, partial [Ectocarpus sp. 6 AP-2014]